MAITNQLIEYLVAAMISWVPLQNQIERTHDGQWVRDGHGYYVMENREEARARYERIATEIAEVAYDEENPPLFKGEEGRLKTALILASIASFEGGYHKWVEDGSCNTAEFQAHQPEDKPHECDGGHAWSNFQIHMYRYVIRGGEMTQAQYLENSLNPDDRSWIKEHSDEIIRGKDLAADPKLAAQVAYYLVRYSTKNFKSLCAYSGEDCDGRHPKASQRWDRAVQHLKMHPFLPETPSDLLDQQILEIMAGIGKGPSKPVLRAFMARGVFAMSIPQLPLN